MASKMNINDRKQLDKYVKNLVHKLIQVVVQSRLGHTLVTECRAVQSSGSDWFNLAINDMMEVAAETRRSLQHQHPLQTGQAVFVDISLTTTDGQTMTMERWKLSKTAEVKMDGSKGERALHTIYNNMTTLLKSTFSVTRATPTYQFSRKQGAESYIICYQIYSDDMETILRDDSMMLGEDHRGVNIGSIDTPTGRLCLDLAYRTQMVHSDHTNDTPLFATSTYRTDHFDKHQVTDANTPASNLNRSAPLSVLRNAKNNGSHIDNRYISASEADLAPDHFNSSPAYMTPPLSTPPANASSPSPRPSDHLSPHSRSIGPHGSTHSPISHTQHSTLYIDLANENNSLCDSQFSTGPKAAFAHSPTASSKHQDSQPDDDFEDNFSHLFRHLDASQVQPSSSSVVADSTLGDAQTTSTLAPSPPHLAAPLPQTSSPSQVSSSRLGGDDELCESSPNNLAFKELSSPFYQVPPKTTGTENSSENDLNNFFAAFQNPPNLFQSPKKLERQNSESRSEDSVSALINAFDEDLLVFEQFGSSLDQKEGHRDNDYVCGGGGDGDGDYHKSQ